MNVAQILKQKGNRIVSLPADARVGEAAGVLSAEGIGALLIMDRAGKVAGILSERDVVRAVANHGMEAVALPVTEVMTANVIFCKPADSIDALMTEMTQRRFRHLPVMDQGRVIGIVSIGDVVKNRIAETVAEAESLRQYIAAG